MKRGARKSRGWIFLALLAGLMLAPTSGMAQESATDTYTNPVSDPTIDVFPSPSVIRAKDGYWYGYTGTQPLLQSKGDDSLHYGAIIRSDNLVDWEYVGDAFDAPDADTRPDWHEPESKIWAPETRYIDGEYRYYYSHARTPPATGYFSVGMATGPTPTGPWTDSGGPVIPEGECDTFTEIDPAHITDDNGTRYLYWGSFRHMCVGELNDAGTKVVGDVTEVYEGFAEGAYVIKRGEYYYLFTAESNCCFGEYSGHQVRAGRSKSPRGPFLDPAGVPMTAPSTKGSFVVEANGNKWVGPGHNSVQTDLSGQDWFVYMAIPRDKPYLDPPYENLSNRKLMIDRLDWVDGWPVVNAGAGPSEEPKPAPVTDWLEGSEFNDGRIPANWRRSGAGADRWKIGEDPAARGFVAQPQDTRDATYLVSQPVRSDDVRAEADLRIAEGSDGTAGLVLAYRSVNSHISVTIDPVARELVTSVVVGRERLRETTTLPDNFDVNAWHHVAAELRGRDLHVEIADGTMMNPQLQQDVKVPQSIAHAGAVGVASTEGGLEADNVGVAELYSPVTEAVAEAPLGEVDAAFSDEFDDGIAPGSQDDPKPWTWVRNREGAEADGAFTWDPTSFQELFRGGVNNASVLLQDIPQGDFTVETKMHFPGTIPANQAGLIMYVNDDLYLKLANTSTRLGTHPGIPDAERTPYQQVDFAYENHPNPKGRTSYGKMYVGTPADTLWLRLNVHIDPVNGEYEIRASSSRDGKTWDVSGVWTLPADADIRMGLIRMNNPEIPAEFEYFRTYRTQTQPGR